MKRTKSGVEWEETDIQLFKMCWSVVMKLPLPLVSEKWKAWEAPPEVGDSYTTVRFPFFIFIFIFQFFD
jgi:hypothetical protein